MSTRLQEKPTERPGMYLHVFRNGGQMSGTSCSEVNLCVISGELAVQGRGPNGCHFLAWRCLSQDTGTRYSQLVTRGSCFMGSKLNVAGAWNPSSPKWLTL